MTYVLCYIDVVNFLAASFLFMVLLGALYSFLLIGRVKLKIFQSLWDAQAILQINSLNLQIRPAGLWLRKCSASCLEALDEFSNCCPIFSTYGSISTLLLVGGDFWCACLVSGSACSWFCLRRLIQMCDSVHPRFSIKVYYDRPFHLLDQFGFISIEGYFYSFSSLPCDRKLSRAIYPVCISILFLVCCHDESVIGDTEEALVVVVPSVNPRQMFTDYILNFFGLSVLHDFLSIVAFLYQLSFGMAFFNLLGW